MSRTIPSCLVICALLCFCACGGHDHSNDAADLTTRDHEAERPTVAVTNWTDRTELFMEYPLFVVGESGRSAIHITDLVDFSPLNAGEATVTLKSADGTVLEFRGGPSRPGIFGVDLEADRAGIYEMTLRVEAPGLQDLHELGAVTVYPAGESSSEPEEEDEGISFLKEQQWTLEFGTAKAEIRNLRNSVTVPAVVQPRAGGEVLLSAPVPGRIDPGSKVPVPGARVRAGDLLARIVPRSDALRDAEGLRAALVEAEQDHGLAVSEKSRVERLVEARALPARRLGEAEAALVASQARLEAARERWSRIEGLSHAENSGSGDLAFEVRAPFDGVVADVRYAPGAGVDENQILARLVDPDRVHIVGSVPESSATDLHSIDAGELLLGDEPPIALPRPLSVGQVVEPVTRTIDVRFAFDNGARRLAIGRSVGLRLFVGGAQPGTAIPDSAIVDDAGRPVVFVQTGGESFARRPVRLGTRAEGWVHVLEGLEPGEWVVIRGAYLVRLASMSTQIPAHGHVH
jgi:cobalt-zinc-cadmium efflux system membrane fusion protein